MRNGTILIRSDVLRAFLVLLGGLTIYSLVVPAFAYAQRIAPQLNTHGEYYDQPQEQGFTLVEEIDPRHGESPPDLSHSVSSMVSGAANSPDADDLVPTIKGSVDIEREFVPDVVFEDMHTVGKGEKLVLIIMDMIATGYSQHGDEFNARFKYPVERDGKVLVPKGALVKGHIVASEDPGRSLSRNGRITLAFDYILMPDGRKVPFKTQYQKGDSTLKAVGRAVGGGIGGTITGAIRGVLVGLKFGGVAGASMTNGATLIGGGGLGALAGLGQGLAQSGDHVLLNEGDEIKVALQEPLELPTMMMPSDAQNEIHAEGLDVTVTHYELGRDPFRVEKQINLTLRVNNQTNYTFGSFDVALMDEYNNTFFVSPFGSDSFLTFQVHPQSQATGQLSFSVQLPEARHYLIFYKPYTREVIAKVSLTEALKKLSTKSQPKPSRKS